VNFALPAITLLLLLLPGILAVQGFLGKIGRKTSDPVGQAGITWAWLVALLIAPIIHLGLSAVLVWLRLAWPPDLHAIFVLLSGQFADQADFSRTVNSVIGAPWRVTFYFVLATLVGLSLGRLAQWLIRGTALDRRFGSLHFGNDWHYLFNGEIQTDMPRPNAVCRVSAGLRGRPGWGTQAAAHEQRGPPPHRRRSRARAGTTDPRPHRAFLSDHGR
jgi:hypothetical protein